REAKLTSSNLAELMGRVHLNPHDRAFSRFAVDSDTDCARWCQSSVPLPPVPRRLPARTGLGHHETDSRREVAGAAGSRGRQRPLVPRCSATWVSSSTGSLIDGQWHLRPEVVTRT